jgi:hypothetical protein
MIIRHDHILIGFKHFELAFGREENFLKEMIKEFYNRIIRRKLRRRRGGIVGRKSLMPNTGNTGNDDGVSKSPVKSYCVFLGSAKNGRSEFLGTSRIETFKFLKWSLFNKINIQRFKCFRIPVMCFKELCPSNSTRVTI